MYWAIYYDKKFFDNSDLKIYSVTCMHGLNTLELDMQIIWMTVWLKLSSTFKLATTLMSDHVRLVAIPTKSCLIYFIWKCYISTISQSNLLLVCVAGGLVCFSWGIFHEKVIPPSPSPFFFFNSNQFLCGHFVYSKPSKTHTPNYLLHSVIFCLH